MAEIEGSPRAGADPVRPAYSRIMVKLSGEAMGGASGGGLNDEAIVELGGKIAEVARLGVEVAVVVGGGNILRGKIASDAGGIERTTADYMGMMATIINAMALQSAIENLGLPTRVLSAIEVRSVCEYYIRRRAISHVEKGRIVILAGGTGNPFFTTDSAAALRAIELGCEVVVKATHVDGIYTADPLKDPAARRLRRVTHQECLNLQVQVMDATAFSLCKDNGLSIVVVSLEGDTIRRAVMGEDVGSLVYTEENDGEGDMRLADGAP